MNIGKTLSDLTGRPRFIRLLLRTSWMCVAMLVSCGGYTPGTIQIKLADNHTRILSTKRSGESTVLGEFPMFPGLDPIHHAGIQENVVQFSNGNMLLKVPDKSVTEKINVWSDTNHLFDVLFVDAQKGTISVLLKENGSNIRILKVLPEETGFIFQANREAKMCNLTILDKNGKVSKQVSYQFAAFPDAVTVAKVPAGYELTHDNIEDEEKFSLEDVSGNMKSVSYEKHDQVK